MAKDMVQLMSKLKFKSFMLQAMIGVEELHTEWREILETKF